jgi:GNAT superfamily N-acetyltransferase
LRIETPNPARVRYVTRCALSPVAFRPRWARIRSYTGFYSGRRTEKLTQALASKIDVLALTGSQAHAQCGPLAEILIACVDGGASVGFMAPLGREKAESYWHDVADRVGRGERVLVVAQERPNGKPIGTVQILLQQPENQPHRADVAKMLVHPVARRRGIGGQLLRFAEDAARSAKKTLLVLDTATGGDAERLYEHLGWLRVGVIPNYALLPGGKPCGTTVLYKHL